MEFNGGQKSTNGGSQPAAAAPRFPSGNSGGSMGMGKMNMDTSGDGNKKMMMAVMAVIVVVLIILVGWLAWSGMSNSGGGKAQGEVKSGQYQAVFLTNGQVYFGKLTNVDNTYIKLTDIYYLQVQQSVQPDSSNKSSTGSNPQVSLAKLGSELHGPDDQMEVNRDQVLFWENLKNDGKVVQAILNNNKK